MSKLIVKQQKYILLFLKKNFFGTLHKFREKANQFNIISWKLFEQRVDC